MGTWAWSDYAAVGVVTLVLIAIEGFFVLAYTKGKKKP